ncbi:MAG: hypothetical protein DI535_24885 [Citrobacter freundii]|nr:MAG: hypothetical protein DI535_24885 [Citrobacter freundii]
MENSAFQADPNNKDSEYTPDLNFYRPDLHDLSEGSESLDESLRMKEQPLMGSGSENETEENQ